MNRKHAIAGIVLAVVIAWMSAAPVSAADINVTPQGPTLAQANAMLEGQIKEGQIKEDTNVIVQPGVYRRIGGFDWTAGSPRHKITIRCSIQDRCIFDGEHATSGLMRIRATNITIIGLTIRRYINFGIQIRDGSHIDILGNRFEKIGSKWGCKNVDTCVGFGGINSRRMRNVNIVGNIFQDLLNGEAKEKQIHSVYVSQRSENINILGNTSLNVSGAHFKTRDGSKNVLIALNRATGGDQRFFYSGMPLGRHEEIPDSNIFLRDNFAEVEKLYVCRTDPDAKKDTEQCDGVVIDQGQLHRGETKEQSEEEESSDELPDLFKSIMGTQN